MTLTPARGLAWAALSFALFVAALFAIFPVLAAVRLFGETPHLAEMAAWSLIWGGLSLVGVLVAARIAFGAWLRPSPTGVAIAAVGITLSAVLNVVLQEWQIGWMGFVDPDFLGPTAGLFAVLIGLAVAVFAAYLVPRQAIGWPVAAVLLGFLGTAVIVASNLPRLEDGIPASSWPLAVVIALCGLYALVTAGLVIRRALDRSHGVP
jgi:hypothetical protein